MEFDCIISRTLIVFTLSNELAYENVVYIYMQRSMYFYTKTTCTLSQTLSPLERKLIVNVYLCSLVF